MAKKKNYMTLFLAYCRKHSIWFSVDIGGYIQECTYLDDDNDISFDGGPKLGSKEAYEWIKKEVKEIKEDLGPVLILRR